MDFINMYAALFLGINLLNTVIVSVKVSGMEDLPEDQKKLAKLYSRSAVISFFITLPIYFRAVGLI